MRQALKSRGAPGISIEIMIASITDNTFTQYNSCFKQWWEHCLYKNISPLSATPSDIINFLTILYNKGSKYGSLNSCRSALSLLIGPQIGSHELVKRFLKGVSKLRPNTPRYNITWDPSTVINHLSTFYPNVQISQKMLGKKVATLLALITAHRVQTLSLVKLENILYQDSKIIIKITDSVKTTREGTPQPVLVIPFFLNKPEICPAQALLDYIKVTERVRPLKTGNLFISFKKPYSAVGSESISRWIKETMTESGIDTNIFSSHSTRHASSSKAKSSGLNIDLIRKTAGWSESSSVFARFYNRPIIEPPELFARTILDSN